MSFVECVEKWQSIAPLDYCGISLEKVHRLILIICNKLSISFTAWTYHSHEPAVSMAIWVQDVGGVMSEYLIVLTAAACLAAAPASADVEMMSSLMWFGIRVWDGLYIPGLWLSSCPMYVGKPSNSLPLEMSCVGSVVVPVFCSFDWPSNEFV